MEKLYSKYVSKLESEDVHTSGCPLCHRKFESNRQIAALVDEVRLIQCDGFVVFFFARAVTEGNAGLSLRAGGRGFSPPTKRVVPATFIGK